MPVSDRSKQDPAVAGHLATGPRTVNITMVIRTDDITKSVIYRLTKATSEGYEEDAKAMGYEPVSFLGPLAQLAGGSPTAKGVGLMVSENDAMILALETLINSMGGPMYSLGHQTGRKLGYDEGLEAGDASGYDRGKTEGTARGDRAGYQRGLAEGHLTGIAEGKPLGVGLIQEHLALLLSADPAVLIARLDPSHQNQFEPESASADKDHAA